MDERANDFVKAISTLAVFPNEKYVDRLYNKAKRCENVSLFNANLPDQPAYGDDPWGFYIDGINVFNHLSLLAEQAAVKALSQYDANSDKHNLRGCANASKADDAANTVFSATSTMLYAEHINSHLSSHGIPSLHELSGNEAFKTALYNKISQPHVIAGLLRQEQLANAGHTVTSALLYSFDYFHSGQGFTPWLDGNFVNSAGAGLLTTWATSLSEDEELGKDKQYLAKFAATTSAHLHHITNSEGVVTPQTLDAHVKALVDLGIVPAGLLQVADADAAEWRTNLHLNKEIWGNLDGKWRSAVIAAAQHATESVRETGSDGQAFGDGFLTGLSLGIKPLTRWWQKTIITGQNVADWINRGRRGTFSGLFNNDAPSVVSYENYETQQSIFHSCFVEGTQVATHGGDSISIEKITEGTVILTNNDPETYGMASDEDVVNPLTLPFLCGLNGDAPFFSPGHVFHTTAGLKAVDPTAAKQENHWIEVGQLHVGHILYRLAENGDGYDHVEVKSIQVSKPADHHTHYYGVHLREGARSYHANGYLVHINYPEITVKSIARHLMPFTREAQLQMLWHIKELQPLFERFGAATMSEVLGRELQGAKRRHVSSHPRPRRKVTSHLRKATRTYTLKEATNDGMEGYQLPVLTIHEGVVILDGVSQHRAVIDKDDCTIRWSRHIPDTGFEHGYISMFDHGLAGSGVVVFSDQPNLRDVQADGRRIRFTVSKPNVSTDQPSRLLNHADLFHPATMHIMRNTEVATAHEAMPLRVPGVGGVGPPVAAMALTAEEPSPPNSPADELGYIDGQDYWNLVVDRDEWKVDDTAKTSPSAPVPFGTIAFATYHAGGEAGIPVPIVSVPFLDQLVSDINAKHLPKQHHLETLYSSVVETMSDGAQMATVMLDCADLLAVLADKPEDGSALSMYNVTFQKSLGSSVVLPILFKTMAVKLATDWSAATGALLEYDPANRGCDGARHMMASTDDSSIPSPMMLATVRSVSTSLAAVRPAPATLTAASARPAPVTMALMAEVPKTTGALHNLSGYNSTTIHTTSQTMVQNLMFYHMKEDDRSTFLNIAQPQSLPLELTANLPQRLKDWIHNKYAPAYISYMLMQTKSKDVNWRFPLSDAEKDKIWYWWSGSGDKCLSRSSEYNELNKLGSTFAIRQLYSTTLQPYIDDDGPKWAKALLKDLTSTDHAMWGLLRNPVSGGENVLNKFCNVLLALDPTGEYADSLFDKIVTFAIAKNYSNPYFPLDKAQAEKDKKWLEDVMSNLILLVLTDDPTMNKDANAEFKKELTDLMKAYGIDEAAEAKVKMNEIMVHVAELTSNIAMSMSTIMQGAKALGGLTGFKAAARAVNNGFKKLTPESRGKQLAIKGVFTVAVAVGYGISAYSTFARWDELDDTQRAIGIISTIALAADVIGRSIDLYQDIKEWREDSAAGGKEEISSKEAVAAQGIDEKVKQEMVSEKGSAAFKETQEKMTGQTTQERLQEIEITEKPSQRSGIVDEDVPNLQPGRNLEEEAKEVTQGTKKAPDGAPASATEGYTKFSTSERILKGVNIALGLALTVAMSIDLANHWDDYNDVGKALNVLSIIVQGLSVLIESVILVADIVMTEAAIAASTVLTVALPILGAVLAVIGIVVMFLLTFLGVTKPKEPPLNPVETFLKDTAHSLISDWASPPTASLTYEATSTSAAHMRGPLTVKATNTTENDVTLTKTVVTLEVGADDACHFSGPATWSLAADGANVNTDGTAGVAPADLTTGRIVGLPRGNNLSAYDFTVAGPLVKGTTQSGPLVLKKNESITITWEGIVNKAGTTTLQFVETLANGDKCRLLRDINRIDTW